MNRRKLVPSYFFIGNAEFNYGGPRSVVRAPSTPDELRRAGEACPSDNANLPEKLDTFLLSPWSQSFPLEFSSFTNTLCVSMEIIIWKIICEV